MNKHLLCVFLMLLIASPVRAALGETAAQLEARYGKSIVIKTDDPAPHYVSISYFTGKLMVSVIFENGRSAQEVYSSTGSRLSGRQIGDFLALNSLGGKWQETQYRMKGEDRRWRLENGTGIAVLQFDGYEMEVCTAKFDREKTARMWNDPNLEYMLKQAGESNSGTSTPPGPAIKFRF